MAYRFIKVASDTVLAISEDTRQMVIPLSNLHHVATTDGKLVLVYLTDGRVEDLTAEGSEFMKAYIEALGPV